MVQTTTPTAISAVLDAKAARAAAEVAELQSVVDWAAAYRVELGVVTETTFGQNGVLLGGIGCPLVSEFDVYDLAASLGMSSESGCGFVGKTLELRYRLRRIWERVLSLEVPKWKAFRIAELTMNLCWEATSYVDRMLAPVLHSCSFAQIDRTVTMAIDTHDPDEAEKRRLRAADERSFDIHLGGRDHTTDSTIAVSGSLALADALDLEQAVKIGAKALGDLGCDETLNVRRSITVGEMARHQLALDLSGGDHEPGSGRGVTIYAHLDPDTDHATLDNPGANDVLIEQIKAWCQTAGTTVTIRPVIDLNTQLTTNAYTPTGKLVEQVRLRDQVCVFPGCTRRARFCDLDHRVPFNKDDPGRRWTNQHRQSRVAVQEAPPGENVLPLGVHLFRTRGLRVDQPLRDPLPRHPGQEARPDAHHHRTTARFRALNTPPRHPAHPRRGHRHVLTVNSWRAGSNPALARPGQLVSTWTRPTPRPIRAQAPRVRSTVQPRANNR